MANGNQLKLIKEGVEVWNKWRKENSDIEVDLSGADLIEADLYRVNLQQANLKDANLREVDLRGAKLIGADLREADLREAKLQKAKLQHVNLTGSNLSGANLRQANLSRAILRKAMIREVNLSGVDLSGADLIEADFFRASLRKANLREADLKEADLREANCYKTKLSHANLTGAVLKNASLVETDLEQAILDNCKVYGISAWALMGEPANQNNLVITPSEEAEITVDDLQVAQFVYLLLNNKNVRNVIDTITSKAVLILGRFTPERIKILDLIREELHKYDYVPILFDFENSQHQSLLETIITLSGMARFIIADVTAATMVREELRSIVKEFPSKPIQPILLNTEDEYVTLDEMRKGYKSILGTFIYKDRDEVIAGLKENVINPSEAWIEARKNEISINFKTEREIELEKENEVLKRKLEKLEPL